jgi:hypothetical protein
MPEAIAGSASYALFGLHAKIAGFFCRGITGFASPEQKKDCHIRLDDKSASYFLS